MSVLGDGLGWLASKAGGLVEDAAMAPLNALASGIGDAFETVLKTLGTAWISIDVPNIATADGRGTPTVEFLQGQLSWLVLWAAVVGLVVGGARMAWEQRGETARELLRGLITLTVVSGCGLAVASLAVTASDQSAQSLVDASTEDQGFGKALLGMLTIAGPAMTPVLAIFLGFIALCVSILQVVLLAFRAGVLVLLAASLPLAASFTSTETGRTWFKRYTAWILALVAYKPAAALCYAAAFRLMGAESVSDDGLQQALVALALMTMSVVALPALLRVLVPAVGALSTGGGGGGAMLMAASSALPMGARMLPAGGGAAMAATVGSGGGSGPAGASGSSGPMGGGGSSGGSGPSGVPGGPGANGGLGAGAAAAQSGAQTAAGGAPQTAGVAGTAGAEAGAGAVAGPAGAVAPAASGAKQAVTSTASQAAGPTNEQGGPNGSNK